MTKATEEEYLRVIYYLKNQKGLVRTSDLADYLKISKAGVSEMMQSLSSRGLVKIQSYSPVNLTKKGLILARKMTFKHRVLETFLSKKLGFPENKIHEEASLLEHAASDEMINKLYSFLGKPKKDPHGKPIVPLK
ncbi:Transcriptional regulator MntR [uncultured archaeon]|nr:Transcriptional regulator MntR [uncultured archaeon]